MLEGEPESRNADPDSKTIYKKEDQKSEIRNTNAEIVTAQPQLLQRSHRDVNVEGLESYKGLSVMMRKKEKVTNLLESSRR